MSQGKASFEEAGESEMALTEIMQAMPKKKSLEFIGHFNDLFLFLVACKKVLPKETPDDTKTEE